MCFVSSLFVPKQLRKRSLKTPISDKEKAPRAKKWVKCCWGVNRFHRGFSVNIECASHLKLFLKLFFFVPPRFGENYWGIPLSAWDMTFCSAHCYVLKPLMMAVDWSILNDFLLAMWYFSQLISIKETPLDHFFFFFLYKNDDRKLFKLIFSGNSCELYHLHAILLRNRTYKFKYPVGYFTFKARQHISLCCYLS